MRPDKPTAAAGDGDDFNASVLRVLSRGKKAKARKAPIIGPADWAGLVRVYPRKRLLVPGKLLKHWTSIQNRRLRKQAEKEMAAYKRLRAEIGLAGSCRMSNAR
jgi:hypothetical protein